MRSLNRLILLKKSKWNIIEIKYERQQPLRINDFMAECLIMALQIFWFVSDILNKVALSFSWVTNGEKILSTKTKCEELRPLNGIAVFTMGWIIIGHFYSTVDFGKDTISVGMLVTPLFIVNSDVITVVLPET